jgi:twitching motility protein PilJ
MASVPAFTEPNPPRAPLFPAARKIRLLGVSLTAFFIVAAAAAYVNSREAAHTARYLAQSGKLQMLSQRLAKDAQLGAAGDAAAFRSLAQDGESLAAILRLLDQGDSELPPTGGAARKVLAELLASANRTLADVQALERGRPALQALSETVSGMEAMRPEFRRMVQRVSLSSGGEAAERFDAAVERLARDVTRAWASGASGEQLAALSAEAAVAAESLAALPAADPAVRRLAELYEAQRRKIGAASGQARELVRAQAAARSIMENADLVQAQSQQLADAYQAGWTARISGAVAAFAGALALLQLLVLAKVYLDDSRRRAEEAESANRRNQEAIRRLMAELEELAGGDLTVRATVSDDVTGAIAEAVNHTAEELRKLAGRIDDAAGQVERATLHAGQISRGLLEAARKQAHEIGEAGSAVQRMAGMIREVEAGAAQSAGVARRTLEATGQGAQAVRNTIAGMDGIRGQIQETAKRIKRLGESSQEIGEIVGLIADITEQTNVLALNAAIQASSAGERGRGFAVVAEEVQHLAERSAEATRQIGALVKAIQGDTQDAVEAMEKSTAGVVEGARLSDVAGQSLHEIERVSNELAVLIEGISASMRAQAEMAAQIARAMQDILHITQQTTDGTRLTANSIDQLTTLAADLKGSVAGFRL